MKYLSGKELAGYVKERQARQVRSLKQSRQVFPKMAILIEEPADELKTKFTGLKRRYGEDIGAEVDVLVTELGKMSQAIKELNQDSAVHGIVVQLPLSNQDRTGELLNLIAPEKDIDGLGDRAAYDSASATAIMWLISGYNISLEDKKVAIIGHGRLVGKPLTSILRSQDIEPAVIDKNRGDIKDIKDADVIISAAGSPGIITADLVKKNAVVIDAGATSQKGVIKGDVDDGLYHRGDLAITPKTGGVGPLTIAVLFDHLLRAASATTKGE